jgi:hypothetical protein
VNLMRFDQRTHVVPFAVNVAPSVSRLEAGQEAVDLAAQVFGVTRQLLRSAWVATERWSALVPGAALAVRTSRNDFAKWPAQLLPG